MGTVWSIRPVATGASLTSRVSPTRLKPLARPARQEHRGIAGFRVDEQRSPEPYPPTVRVPWCGP